MVIGDFALAMEQFQPEFCLGAFLQGDFQLADKIGAALGVPCFIQICTDRRRRTDDLVDIGAAALDILAKI